MNLRLFLLWLFLPLVLPAQWKKVYLPVTKDLYDIHFTGAKGWIAGHDNAVLHSSDSGKSWSVRTPSTPVNFRAVWSRPGDTVLITGENARILMSTDGGVQWSQRFVRTAAYAYDMQFRGRNGIVVGKDMLAVSSIDGGLSWSTDTTLPVFKKLNAVAISPGGFCWAVGDSGYILRKNISARRWENVKYPTNVDLNTVSCISDSVIIISGGMPDSGRVGVFYNILLRSTDTGRTWMQTVVNEMKIINTSVFFSSDTGFLAGSNGIISKCYDPFTKRGQQISGTASTLHSMYFKGNTGFITGDGGVLLRTDNRGGFGLDLPGTRSAVVSVFPNPAGGKIEIHAVAEVKKVTANGLTGRSAEMTRGEDGKWNVPFAGTVVLTITLINGHTFQHVIQNDTAMPYPISPVR